MATVPRTSHRFLPGSPPALRRRTYQASQRPASRVWSPLDDGRSVAETRDARESLVDLHDAPADRITLGAVVHEIPGAIGDLARVLGRRRLPQAVDEQQFELLQLLLRMQGLL